MRPDDPSQLRQKPPTLSRDPSSYPNLDAESGLSLVFLTNAFHLPALTIAAIYRRRWQIELFFRWIKQHLRLRGFFSNDPNGVRVQVWTAICAYLLVAIAKKENALRQSLHQVLQIVSLSCLEKVPLIHSHPTGFEKRRLELPRFAGRGSDRV